MQTPANSVRRTGGFTFVEILAAMLFMAIVIPVTVEGLSVANRAGIMAERKRVAARLADSRLTELVATGEWQKGGQAGDFGADFPEYRWKLINEGWSEDSIRMLSIEVSFTVQGQDSVVRLSTLVSEATS